MQFSERQSLLPSDRTGNRHNSRIRNEYEIITRSGPTYNWKSVTLALIPALLISSIGIALLISISYSQNENDTATPDGKNAGETNSSHNLKLSAIDRKIGDLSNPGETILSNNITPSKMSDPKLHPNPDIVTISKVGNLSVYHYNFLVTEGSLCPDNFRQNGYLINNQSPGPEIRIPQYSILIVHVTNNLKSELTIHFHGIHQRQSFLSDGVPNLTQRPIPPGGTFTYEIDTWPQVGTFFYHAHTGMNIVWIYGPLIIEDDKNAAFPLEYGYYEDRVFTLNGVYHEPLDVLMERIAGPVHRYPATTSSITVNGKSFRVWESEDNAKDNVSQNCGSGFHQTTIKKGKTYRFRFINAASDSLLSCSVASHNMTIIEMDGIYVHPVRTDRLVLTPGQRYSALVTADQELGNYLISCNHIESPGPLNGVAILHYEGFENPPEEMLKKNYPEQFSLPLYRWIMDELKPNIDLNQTDFYKVPVTVDQELVIDVFEAIVGQQHVYLINGHFYEEPAIPYFMQLKQGRNISNPPQVFETLEGDVIQIVFQNQRTGDFCFSHPWHIHGGSFHIVGEGSDRYDPVKDGQRIQEDILSGKIFQFRDTLTVYANQTVGEEVDGAFCGWAAIRYRARNSGVWLVHCHVTPHMIMGKKFVIWEHAKDDPYLSTLLNAKRRF